MKDNKFTFFESYHEALSRVPDEQYGRIVRAICNYAFYDVEPDFKDNTDFVAWMLIKPIVDNGKDITKVRSESGAKGGANGKGVSRNAGNRYAAKDESIANNSKTIANENFANDESIATESQNNSGKDMERKGLGKEMEWEWEKDAPTPPQLEDVVLYFNEHDKGKVSDPNKFFSHFDSLGWVKNGQPIVNWQSRADMWINEDVKKSAGKPLPEKFIMKPPAKEEYAEKEAKRKKSEYDRFRGMVEQVQGNPESLARKSIKTAFENGSLDSYPDLKQIAESLFKQ